MIIRISTHSRTITRHVAVASIVAAFAACAGGASDAADTSRAAAAGAAVTVPESGPLPAGTPATGTAVAATSDSANASAAAMLDPNGATREQLLTLPGMTPAAADALVAGRPHANMVAVDSALAKQLGAAERKTLYGRLWKPLDLNTASGEEIVLIPGVGARMRHEFEEYRPYRSIEQFRREIGKYVDKDEVARLERYVAIR